MSKSKSRPKPIRHNFFSDLYVNVGDELINRENVWHFYAYFAEEAAQALQEFIDIAEITDDPCRFSDRSHNPVDSMGKEHFGQILGALHLLIDYYKLSTDHYYYEPFIYNGREIDFERGDTIVSLLNSLHRFVIILPYLNRRHYPLSKDLYDKEHYHKFSFEELENLDRTLAKTILPTFIWFANHSIFCPKQLRRLYTYPSPDGSISDLYDCSKRWDDFLASMVKSWEWIRDRKVANSRDGWEDVPDEIHYGLHLFAEYLPEMQND